jgi:DNA primase
LHGRVIIPLSDSLGRVVGFTGRYLNKSGEAATSAPAVPLDAAPKYVNTHETEIFHKGECLYGYTFAREMLRLKKKGIASELYILEGQLKTIAALENGFPAVAAGGTGFTERQSTLIYNLSPDVVYIALDADAAGLKAALRLAPSLRNLEINVKVAELIIPDQAELPPGKIDTDDLMAAGIPIKWAHYDLIEWLFYSFCPTKGTAPSSTDALTISRIILPIIGNHPNSIVKETEIKQLSELSGLSEHALFDELDKLPTAQTELSANNSGDATSLAPKAPVDPSFSKRMTPARYLCALLLQEHVKDHLYAENIIWFRDLINWPEMPLPLIEELHLIIKIKKHSVITGIPAISACEQIAPQKVGLYSYWLSTVNENLTVEKLNQLQIEIINTNKQGVAA